MSAQHLINTQRHLPPTRGNRDCPKLLAARAKHSQQEQRGTEGAHTLAKLMSEMRPNAEAPTKEAVAAEAMADTENRVPMFNMHVASISEFVIFWLACTERRGQPTCELWISAFLAGMSMLQAYSKIL